MKTLLLSRAAASPVQPHTLWLVIEQLDAVPLPGIGTRPPLDKIYSDASLLAVMRVILVGLADTLTSVNPKAVFTEKLDDPQELKPDEVEECLSRVMTAAGVVPAAGEARRHRALMLGATRQLAALGPQGSRLPDLASALAQRRGVDPVCLRLAALIEAAVRQYRRASRLADLDSGWSRD